MATLEDKILGNKLENYCSSSSSGSGEEDSGDETNVAAKSALQMESVGSNPIHEWSGSSMNTGPKGVLTDWQQYRQMRIAQYMQKQCETLKTIQDSAYTVKPMSNDNNDDEDEEDEDLEFSDLPSADTFLMDYRKQRMQEMINSCTHTKKFGRVIHLTTSGKYLQAIDNEDKVVLIIVHIYENTNLACKVLNNSLEHLCKMYDSVKFCTVQTSIVGMSSQFKMDGVPALLIYKGGELIANFIKVTDQLGQDFYPDDLQAFLVEHGILEDKTCQPAIINDGISDDDDDDDC